MARDVEKILDLIKRGRIAVVNAAGSRRSELALALSNSELARSEGMLRFSFPENYYQFKSFLNGAMSVIITAAGYAAKYPGLVLVELDEEAYESYESMPLAFLELLSLTTCMHTVLLCGSEELAKFMSGCAARFAVPGMVALEDGDSGRLAVEQTANRLGVRFANAHSIKQTVQLYEEISSSPVFNADAFLKSLVGADRWISSASIQQECSDEQGYFRMCKSMLERRFEDDLEQSVPVRRIGFFTSAERERQEREKH